jgi:hypothetical protein
MKKDERLNTKAAEANIELNEKMNKDNGISHKRKVSSVTEANMAIQEEFYGKNNKEDVLRTYLSNNTPAIKINQSNKRDRSIITS